MKDSITYGFHLSNTAVDQSRIVQNNPVDEDSSHSATIQIADDGMEKGVHATPWMVKKGKKILILQIGWIS